MLSVVVPTLNAAATLEDCLARLSDVRDVVVVDGGSRDSTQAIAAASGARLVVTEPGRGGQLRLGAEAARGDWLLFLHADTILAPGWRAAAERHMAGGEGGAACFRFRLADPVWQARWVERAVAARVALFGLPYGDQGLLIPRSLYDRVGGYRPLPLMEDVDLVRRIGRRRLALLGEQAWTGAERWRRDGWLARPARNLFCLGLYALGMRPERIARFYA